MYATSTSDERKKNGRKKTIIESIRTIAQRPEAEGNMIRLDSIIATRARVTNLLFILPVILPF